MLSVSYENAFSHHTQKTYMLSSLDSVGNLKIQNLTHHENLFNLFIPFEPMPLFGSQNI